MYLASNTNVDRVRTTTYLIVFFPTKISDQQKGTTPILKFFVVVFSHWQHLVEVGKNIVVLV